MAKKNHPSDEELVLDFDDDAEIFIESPTVPSAVVIPEDALPADFEGVIPQTEIVSSDPESGLETQAGEVPMIAAPLPEMSAEMWQAGIQAVVTVPDTISTPAWPAAEEWEAEARLFRREADLADMPEEAAALKLAAARSAGAAGAREDATALCNEALELTPDSPDALRARARLAESEGDFDGAHDLWARLAVAAETDDERAFYAALAAEWTLARDGALTVAAREAIPAGLARALAAVEEALVGGSTGDAAPALADAGRAVGGSFGAALVEEAARFFEMQGQMRQAEAQRASASEIDREARAGLLGHLRDAARLPDRDAARVLADLHERMTLRGSPTPPAMDSAGQSPAPSTRDARLPASSPLAHGVARWAARVARRRGDNALAGTLLDALPATTTAAARDRLDFEVATGAPLDSACLERLRADVGDTEGSVMVIWIEVGNLLRRGETAAAAALLAGGIEAHPDAAPLGLLAEELASVATDPATKAAALDLWLRADPARRAEAALARAQVQTATSEPSEGSEPPATGSGRQSRPSPTRSGESNDDELATRAALQTAIESAPGSALFWMAAEADARAGRHADAAATLEYGAAMWVGSSIEPALRACAAAHLARVDPVRAASALRSPEVAQAFGLDAGVRVAERAGDRDRLVEVLADAAALCTDPERRTSIDARRAALLEDDAQRALVLGQALELTPGHPSALALWALASEVAPDAAAAALWRAGAPDSGAPALARLLRLAATISAGLDQQPEEALRRAQEIVAQRPGDRPSRLALVRAARGQPEALDAMPDAPDAAASDPIELVVAEARAQRDAQRAIPLLRNLGDSRFGAEARRVLARVAASGVPGIPPRLLFGTADGEAAVVRDQLTTLLDATRAGRWETVLVGLEKFPPQEAPASPATLFSAALVAEGRSADPAADPEAARLAEAALVGADDDAHALPLLGLARVADGKSDLALRARAFELAAKQVAASGEQRQPAVASIEAGLARLHTGAGAAEQATKSWRAALAMDSTFLPAALALRREAAARGDLRAAIDATEIEANCLLVPSARVDTLMLAAALATEAPDRKRALAFLRAALESDPAHEAAFEQLRSLLSEANDAAGLAEALSARIAVAPNPFEVTSLRLARAEVLATKLGDRTGACRELDAILEKQPEHPRALARLSELYWEDEKWTEAGETYLRRALIERAPRTLRDVFLRIGHIYAHRVPDHARAITAYERVRAVEPDNRDALRALSELYAGEGDAGDAKLALPVTERLVAIETEPRRRTAFRVRLGELLMRTGDLRRAGTELRRAVDATPRDVPAVTALAQLLERVRDQAGRRAMIDHSVGLLRHDVERGELSVETLRGLAALLPLRDRPRAGAAAAQLVAALEAGRIDRTAVPRSIRHLEALRRPEIDDRVFPPGIPPGIRQIMRLVGPALRPSGPELSQQLSRHGVIRSDRVGRTEPPRPLFDSMAAMLQAGDFDLYIKAPAAKAGPVPVRVEPGSPAAIIIGAPIVDFGPAALRFVAARTLRLVATNLDLLLSVSAEEAAAVVVGIIRQFVPEYRHPGVRDALAEAEASRAARLMPRKVRPAVMPFAVESAGEFDPLALHAAVRDGANAVGLLAAGDLPAALSVVLATSGMSATSPTQDWDGALSLSPIVAHPEGLALLRFAVSDDYDDLVLAMESG